MRLGSRFALIALIVSAPAIASGAPQQRPVVPALLMCEDPAANAEAARLLAAAINARVAALPEGRRSAEDIEAAIVFEISQRNLCPGVARAALASLSGGTGPFATAVMQVASTFLPGTGTAGLRPSGGSGAGTGSFFSSPVVGIGGGSSNYAQ